MRSENLRLAMHLDEFRKSFPEFAKADTQLVQRQLDFAFEEIAESSLFGAMFTQAQGLLAAHNLALSPFGNGLRQNEAEDGSTYYDRYLRILRACYPGGLVL